MSMQLNDEQIIHKFGEVGRVRTNLVALYIPKSQSNIEMPDGSSGFSAMANKEMNNRGLLVISVGPDVEDLEAGDRVRVRNPQGVVDVIETEKGVIQVFDEMNITFVLNINE